MFRRMLGSWKTSRSIWMKVIWRRFSRNEATHVQWSEFGCLDRILASVSRPRWNNWLFEFCGGNTINVCIRSKMPESWLKPTECLWATDTWTFSSLRMRTKWFLRISFWFNSWMSFVIFKSFLSKLILNAKWLAKSCVFMTQHSRSIINTR